MANSKRRTFGHEPAGIKTRPILTVAATLVAAVLIIGLALYWSLNEYLAPHYAQAVARSAPIPPLPRLQAHAADDMAAVRAQQEELLSSYAWLDPSRTTARLPIQRAMVIYARLHATPHAESVPSPSSKELQQ